MAFCKFRHSFGLLSRGISNTCSVLGAWATLFNDLPVVRTDSSPLCLCFSVHGMVRISIMLCHYHLHMLIGPPRSMALASIVKLTSNAFFVPPYVQGSRRGYCFARGVPLSGHLRHRKCAILPAPLAVLAVVKAHSMGTLFLLRNSG